MKDHFSRYEPVMQQLKHKYQVSCLLLQSSFSALAMQLYVPFARMLNVHS